MDGAEFADGAAMDELPLISSMVRQFAQAWQLQPRPCLDDFLPREGSFRLALLKLLIEVDLDQRRRIGDIVTIDDYLQRYPELTTAQSDVTMDPHTAAAKTAATSLAAMPAQIGRYRVEKILGQGGFGVVYLAHDDQLQRLVAIKVPHARLVHKTWGAQAHLAEARTVANLDHPNIIPVHDIGSTAQFPCYFVSKYIDGTDLSKRIKQSRLSLQEAVELVATVAEALHHAHKQGLVHRDIKPGNILLDKEGKAFVNDFGLALREQDIGTGPRYAGSPAYMSPEQARGEGHRVDGRSDIFSLGIVFYELLVGRRPFKADSTEGQLDRIATSEVCPPRHIDENLPKEVDRICLKALAKRASERYASAQLMADDLRFFLAHCSALEKSTALARKESDLTAPAATPVPATILDSRPVRIVPKGLRSFDAADADFFLELLPGARDRDGLPDSVRFWKTRIEATDAGSSFQVGLIYGPSGCGKSSLMKAGLLPRLADFVTTLYLEATAEDTEARLLNGLRRQVPDLPPNFNLIETLAALRRGQYLKPGGKILLVLDQFEQWLHGQPNQESSELVQALRHCEGARLQCILMVRDDFWMAATRFMGALEIRLAERENSAAVDLFPVRHAENVLAAFGRAFGELPRNSSMDSKEQREFIEQSVAGLAEEGKVVSVRLALFAEMVKAKTWLPATLKQIGGTKGVGVTFLEETFTIATAPPEHRLHQKAAQAVLRALLPEPGTDIRGHMRSYQELLEASGYAQSPKDFEDLIHILDSELRLITPTDPDGVQERARVERRSIGNPTGEQSSAVADPSSPPSSTLKPDPVARYFQLTHDYLVPSLRDWLTRKQRETRQGQAELRLSESGQLWKARPEAKLLPSLSEWLFICLYTNPKNWSDGERRMMLSCKRKHLRNVTTFVAVASLLIAAGVFLYKNVHDDLAAVRADGIVRRLLSAKLSDTPAILTELDKHDGQLTTPLLQETLAAPFADTDRQLHARLGLLSADPSQVAPLSDYLLRAEAQEFPVLAKVLEPFRARLIEDYWKILNVDENSPARRFRAAVALASFDPASPRWQGRGRWVADQLVAQPLLGLTTWVDGLRPVKNHLLAPLVAIFQERSPYHSTTAPLVNTPHEKEVVLAEIIGDYAARQPDILAVTLAHARPGAFAVLLSRLKADPDQAASTLRMALAKVGGAMTANEAASHRTNLALALLQLGYEEYFWPLLTASKNPRARSFAIDRFATAGCPPHILLSRLEAEPDSTVRAAILLALGGFDEKALPAQRRAGLAPKLNSIYYEDSSGAVHGAVHWLLGQWGIGPGPAPTVTAVSAGEKGWYVNSVGQTMVRIAGPIDYLAGTSASIDSVFQIHVAHSFDIGMTEVTVGQFRRFLSQRTSAEKKADLARFAELPDDMPATRVSWYLAVEFCNWLNKQEGIPEDQWCYQPNEDGAYEDGMIIVDCYPSKTGYRLPVDIEWEYACRGGADTWLCYGDANDLLPRYAWFADNAPDRAMPAARLLPNVFGLFDMHGNVMEWCQNTARPILSEYPPDGEIVTNTVLRAERGGSFATSGRQINASRRAADRPTYIEGTGFRVVRGRP